MTNKRLFEEGGPTGASVQYRAELRHRILVVDGDNDLRLLYADALARPGYHVDGAEDGAAGWEALQANNYNLLITEHEMPVLTGVELVRRLRAARMALPVVMAAGRLPMDELVRSPSLRLAAVLTKPFYISQLLGTVKAVLRMTSGQHAPPLNWLSQLSAVGSRMNIP